MNEQDKETPMQDASLAAESGEISPGGTEDGADDGAPMSVEDAPTGADEPAPGKDAGPSSSSILAWTGLLGLLIALLTAAGAAYLWLEQRNQQTLSQRVAALQMALDTRSSELAELSNSVESMNAASQQFDKQLGTLTTQFDRQLEDIPLRIARIERTLDKIPGVANQARSAWLLAEAEYYLRIANAQLNLAGNVEVSLRALALADEKLRDLADPGLTRVRSLLSDEQTALRAVPRPDAEGIVLALGSLARALETLPLDRDAPGRFGIAASAERDESGLQRAWRVITEAFFSIISVKRDDNTVTPLMSAAEESMLIRSLDIELQISRLALIRNEKDLYQRSLQAVVERLEQYFDTESAEVMAALVTVEKAAAADLPDELPNISGSLSLLLRLREEAASP
jgi:uroporphyrin-3 C-methyltransferase